MDLLTISFMQLLANNFGAELKLGDYPYAAWYTQEAYEKSEWKGRWFANPVLTKGMSVSLYLPENKKNTDLRFFHELGHIKDYSEQKSPIETWANEVSAWKNAVMIMNELGYPFNKEYLRKFLNTTLFTYIDNHENEALYNHAVTEILSQDKLKGSDPSKGFFLSNKIK